MSAGRRRVGAKIIVIGATFTEVNFDMAFKEGDLVKHEKFTVLFKFIRYANKYKKWCVVVPAIPNTILGKDTIAYRTHKIGVPTDKDVACFIAHKLKGDCGA